MNTEKILKVVKSRKFTTTVLGISTSAAGFAVGYKTAQSRLRSYYEEVASKEIAEAREHYRVVIDKQAVEMSDPVTYLQSLDGYEGVIEQLGYAPASDIPKSDPVPEVLEEIAEGVEDISEQLGKKVVRNVFQDAKSANSEWDQEEEEAKRRELVPPDRAYIISHDEFMHGTADYIQANVTFFEGDDVLMDEKQEVIHDVEGTVGGTDNIRFGHGSEDKNVVYIRNDKIQLDFEVIRSQGHYSQEVLGFEHSMDSGRSRRFRHED